MRVLRVMLVVVFTSLFFSCLGDIKINRDYDWGDVEDDDSGDDDADDVSGATS